MNLTIGYSPCPNDCFVFDALVNKKIETEGLNFEVILEDIETLNKKALEGHLDITKLSFHAYVYNLKQKNDRKEIKTRPLKYTVTEYFLNSKKLLLL